jgi:hypothetical protein
MNICRLGLTGTSNIPWAAINSNTHDCTVNLDGQNLKDFNPAPTLDLSYQSFEYATNVPWPAIALNNNANGLTYIYWTGVDLTGFDASGKDLTGSTMPVGVSSPSDFVEATGITPSAGTVWIDGTTPWGS